MKRLIACVILSFIFYFCVFGQQNFARAEESAPDETAQESKAHPLWTHDFEQLLYKIEALPNGFLAVTSGPKNLKKKSKENQEGLTLSLLDGRNGNVVWKGPERGRHIVAGEPHPIVIAQEENALTLKALDREGGEVWTMTDNGVSLSVAVDLERNELIFLKSKESWWTKSNEQELSLKVFSLIDGTIVWEAALGTFRLPIVVPSTVMQVLPKSVWIAAGGKVLLVNRENKNVVFNQPLEATLDKEAAPTPKWYATDQFAALAMDNSVSFMNADTGLQWTKTFEKMMPDTVAVTESAVVAGYRIPKRERAKVVILAYDRKSGVEKWRYRGRDGIMAKWDRVLAPPLGLAVNETIVAFALKNKLIGLDSQTGKPVYSVGLGKKTYTYAKEVEKWNNLALIYGKFEMRAHDLMSGEMKWKIKDFGDPKDYTNRLKKISAGLMQIGFQAAASMQEFSAQSMSSLANVKVAGKSGSHYSHYILSPSARYQLTAAAQSAGRNSAWYRVGATEMDFEGLNRWIELVHYSPNDKWHIKNKVIDTNMFALLPFRTTSLAVVSLEDGAYKEALPIKADGVCMTALCADMAEGRVYFANHKAAPACSKYKHIQAYQIPKSLK